MKLAVYGTLVLDNADLAQVSGINTKMVITYTWLIGGALACMAGTMLSLDVNLRPEGAGRVLVRSTDLDGAVGPDDPLDPVPEVGRELLARAVRQGLPAIAPVQPGHLDPGPVEIIHQFQVNRLLAQGGNGVGIVPLRRAVVIVDAGPVGRFAPGLHATVAAEIVLVHVRVG